MSNDAKVVLIGWDGADWNHINPLLDKGLLPNLQSLIQGGVMGNIETLTPILSPMLWNSVATGKYGDEHGILNFTEPNPSGLGFRPFSSVSRKTKAIWNILSQNSMASNVVNWWASYPAEPIKGCVVSNNFLRANQHPDSGKWNYEDGTFHPRGLEQYVGDLRIAPGELDQSAILPFIPEAARIDQTEDKHLQKFCNMLAETVSIQANATWLLENNPANLNAMYFEGIDHFCHGFMHFAPPRLPNIPEEIYELYKGVVDGAYRFHDMMLGAVLRMIDDDTYVMLVSDHGFQSGATRPRVTPNEPAGPAYWHRPLGIFALKGPGIKKDERIYGASLLDITPTLLTIFDLPVGEDMSGKVLVSAFENSPEINRIPSWDHVAQENSGMHPPGTEWDQEQSPELIKQFVELGYIEDPDEDKAVSARKTQIEIDYNLARVHMSKGQTDEALKLFSELMKQSPWEKRFVLHTVRCLFECGYLEQAKRLIEKAFPDDKLPAAPMVLMGRILSQQGDREKGIEYLERANRVSPNLKGVYLELARTWFKNREFKKALDCCRRELDRYPECPISMQVAGASLLKMGEFEPAAELLLDSVGIRYQNAMAHYYLAAAFDGLGDTEQAIVAFTKATKFRQGFVSAHRYLAKLYARNGNDEMATLHRSKSKQYLSFKRSTNQELKKRALQVWGLPEIPTPEERRQILAAKRPRKSAKQEAETKTESKTFVLVSGLPRSGTSLMMQMLQAGGIEPMTDGLRTADEDNPQGYLEWEAIKSIAKNPELLDQADVEGKAIKAVSMLMPQLPSHHQYLVVFMERPIPEVVASQFRMIDRNSEDGIDQDEERDIATMATQLNRHRNAIRQWLFKAGNFRMLNIAYGDLIDDPESQISQVVDFLGKERLPTSEKMKDVIKTDLYRQRKTIVDRY